MKGVVIKVTTSVLMAVYNGEKYITEQLDSIRLQSVSPDEVLICDDNSCDKSVELIAAYIKKNSLISWKILVNEKNLGWRKNFFLNLKNVSGDVVFFSDQDDIWKADKIEKMLSCFSMNDRVYAIGGYAQLIDAEGNNLTKEWEIPSTRCKGSNGLIKSKSNIKGLSFGMWGCGMAIKRELISYLKYVKPDELDLISHDVFFWKIATILGGAYRYDRVVVERRIHDSNSSDVNKISERYNAGINFDRRMSKLKVEELLFAIMLRISTNLPQPQNEKVSKGLKKHINFIRVRMRALKKRNIFLFLSILFGYKFYPYAYIYIDELTNQMNINKVARAVRLRFKS